MARIRPFAGWRYASEARDISSLTAPPYDVISEDQRRVLLDGDTHNVVALELPEGPMDPAVPRNRYETGRETWARWQGEGVVVRDEKPCVYLVEQRFSIGGRDVRRRALVVAVGLEPFEAGVVLPHERTLPKALGDRYELIKATGANFSQVMGLYEDAEGRTDGLMDRIAEGEPLSEAVGEDNVVSRLWASDDLGLAENLAAIMHDKRIFIADGHHRYTTALAYRDLRRADDAKAGVERPDAPYEYVLMALVNMDDPELVVLPTHRVADAAADFDPAAFREALLGSFIVEELPKGHPAGGLDDIAEPPFHVQTRGEAAPYRVRLRPEVDLDRAVSAPFSAAWKRLDVAVLQELILDPLLGIHPDRPETLERLSFYKDPHEALKATEEHDVAFILRPTKMEQLRAVALAGETMPQKSTYFYPKLLSGLVFRSAE